MLQLFILWTIIDSENNQSFWRWNLLENTQKELPNQQNWCWWNWSCLEFRYILDWRDYGPENIRGNRYILVMIDKFNKFGWKAPLKNDNAQTKKDSSESILMSSKRKPKLFETDRGK